MSSIHSRYISQTRASHSPGSARRPSPSDACFLLRRRLTESQVAVSECLRGILTGRGSARYAPYTLICLPNTFDIHASVTGRMLIGEAESGMHTWVIAHVAQVYRLSLGYLPGAFQVGYGTCDGIPTVSMVKPLGHRRGAAHEPALVLDDGARVKLLRTFLD